MIQKIKSHPGIDVSNPFWYLDRSDWKSSCITSSALSLIIISMLSPFECMTHSSSLSLDDIKLIVIVYWIFHISDFLRPFRSFKYDLILLRYSSTDNVLCSTVTFIVNKIVTAKITYSNWFTIIFFFMLKKVIPNYPGFDWFILFSQSKKISYIFMFSSIILSFSSLNVLSLCCEKK